LSDGLTKEDEKMTKSEAIEWVRESDDEDQLDVGETEEAFAALYGRPADDEDRHTGLWSLICAGQPWDEGEEVQS
jgi:hypothetical protein